MTYQQLLLSTGGGVIDPDTQRDEQSPVAVLAIGLGGTGVDCLKNLKRQVYSRLKADNPDSVVPEYSHIKFLAVDTDRNSLEADGKINSIDEVTEFFPISSDNIQSLLAQTRVLAGQPECKWLKNSGDPLGGGGLSILAATAGAGGVRQIGRLLMIQHSATFASKVGQLINDAKRGLPEGHEVHIHIFSGMGGDTGAGTFLDACYLVRKALQDIGEAGHAQVCGYFFLPDVNMSKPTISANPAVAGYVQANGFASMKELDHCMNLETNGDEWNQQYQGFTVQTQKQPVDICHLISASTATGTLQNNGYQYAMNVVSDFVMQFLVKNSINMNSHISNYFRAMGMVQKEAGAIYRYCVLGASSAVVPMRQITTYLASRLFEGMSYIQGASPSDSDIKKVAEENGLTFDDLFAAVVKDQRNAPVRDHSNCEPKDYVSRISLADDSDNGFTLPEDLMKPYREGFLSQAVNTYESNVRALTHQWSFKNITEDQKSISKMCRIFYYLRDAIQDPQRGPFYASVVLKGTGRKNLVDILRGIQEETTRNLQAANGDQDLRIRAVCNSKKQFVASNFTNRSKRFDDMMNAVRNYFTNEARIEALT